MTLGNYAGEGYLLHPSGICPMLWDYESFSVSERRAQMVVLGLLLTLKQKHPQPKWQGNVPCSCEQITPNSSQSAQVYTTHSTNISTSLPCIPNTSLQLCWWCGHGWSPLLGHVGSGKEPGQSRAAIPPVNAKQMLDLLQILPWAKSAISSSL